MDMQNIYSKIDFSQISDFKKIYIGFSGGADSTALVIALAKYAETADLDIEAVHFEHGIRGAISRADAEWCRGFCETRNITFRQIDLGIDSDSKNLEATARELRLDSWKEIVDSAAEAVALGQHADDRIENLFLRLMRGSNATGLTSMRSSQKIGDITFFRPLITLRRSEIETFLKNSGISNWRNDHTNKENIYRRNFIRNKILPLIQKEFPDADKALLKSITVLEADADCLEKEAGNQYSEVGGQRTEEMQCTGRDQASSKNTTPRHSAYTTEKVEFFAKMHPAIQARVLRLWLSDTLEKETIPTADFLKRFSEAVSNYDPADGRQILIPLDKEIVVAIEKGFISIKSTERIETVNHVVKWNWKENPVITWNGISFRCEKTEGATDEELNDLSHQSVYFSEIGLPDKLIIRNRIPGDRMVPFGKESEVKIKKMLQQTDLRLDDKKNIPVITTLKDKIIWIPGVRRANFANVSDSSADIVRIST